MALFQARSALLLHLSRLTISSADRHSVAMAISRHGHFTRNHPMLKRFAFEILMAVALFGIAGRACADPSFDCEKALTQVENMICATPALGQLDREMNESYAKDLGAPAKWLSRLQANWLAQRNKCADAACLTMSYQGQAQALEALKFLGWDNESAYDAVIDIAKDQDALIRGQRAWRSSLDRCADTACVQRSFAQRQAALESLKNSVARAGMKRYVNRALGIGFDYLENRTVLACSEPDCVQLMGRAMGMGSPYILEIKVVDGNLAAAAGTLWERRGGQWFASGRGGYESPVEDYTEGWKGLQAATMCGFGDHNGFHPSGECNTYLRSNGKRAVIIRNDGVSGKDGASLKTVSTVHFLR